MVIANKEQILQQASDFYKIYWNGDKKYIQVDAYFFDEGEDNGEGTSRCVEYSDFIMPLYDFIENNYDVDWYSEYGAKCKQSWLDMTPDEAYVSMDDYYNHDTLPLSYSELNMNTPCGHYVNLTKENENKQMSIIGYFGLKEICVLANQGFELEMVRATDGVEMILAKKDGLVRQFPFVTSTDKRSKNAE